MSPSAWPGSCTWRWRSRRSGTARTNPAGSILLHLAQAHGLDRLEQVGPDSDDLGEILRHVTQEPIARQASVRIGSWVAHRIACTIARIAAFTSTGSVGQRSIRSARSESAGRSRAPGAPDSALPAGEKWFFAGEIEDCSSPPGGIPHFPAYRRDFPQQPGYSVVHFLVCVFASRSCSVGAAGQSYALELGVLGVCYDLCGRVMVTVGARPKLGPMTFSAIAAAQQRVAAHDRWS